jgi:hypothetical protein
MLEMMEIVWKVNNLGLWRFEAISKVFYVVQKIPLPASAATHIPKRWFNQHDDPRLPLSSPRSTGMARWVAFSCPCTAARANRHDGNSFLCPLIRACG